MRILRNTLAMVALASVLLGTVPAGLTFEERAANGIRFYDGPLPVVRIGPDGYWCDTSNRGQVRITWTLREDGTGTADIWLADREDTRPDWMIYNLKRVRPNVWEGIIPDDGDSAAPDMGNPIAEESYFTFHGDGFHQDLTVLFVDGTRHTCGFERSGNIHGVPLN